VIVLPLNFVSAVRQHLDYRRADLMSRSVKRHIDDIRLLRDEWAGTGATGDERHRKEEAKAE
jgi:hypothetical protein